MRSFLYIVLILTIAGYNASEVKSPLPITNDIVEEKVIMESLYMIVYNTDRSQCYLFDPQTRNLAYIAIRGVSEQTKDQFKISKVAMKMPSATPLDAASTGKTSVIDTTLSRPSPGTAEKAEAAANDQSKQAFIDVVPDSAASTVAAASKDTPVLMEMTKRRRLGSLHTLPVSNNYRAGEELIVLYQGKSIPSPHIIECV